MNRLFKGMSIISVLQDELYEGELKLLFRGQVKNVLSGANLILTVQVSSSMLQADLNDRSIKNVQGRSRSIGPVMPLLLERATSSALLTTACFDMSTSFSISRILR